MEPNSTDSENEIFLSCNLCSQVSTGLAQFENHVKLHGGKVCYKCGICRKSCSSYRFSKIHVKYRHRRHGKNKILDRHSKLGFYWAQFLEIRNNWLIEANLRKLFKCNYCSSSFRRQESLILHWRRHLQENKSLDLHSFKKSCQNQNLSSSSSSVIQNPRKEDQMTRSIVHAKTLVPTNSGVVEFARAADNQLTENNLTSGGRPFKCQICGLSFKTLVNFKCHQVVYHKDTLGRTSANMKFMANNKFQNYFSCFECALLLPTFNAFWEHQHRIHYRRETPAGSQIHSGNNNANVQSSLAAAEVSGNIQNVVNNGNEDVAGEYSCPVCPATFGSKTSLKRHMVIHFERPYQCSVCGKSFKRAFCLRSHMITHDGNRQRLICDQCPKTFLTNAGLQSHVKVKHRPC